MPSGFDLVRQFSEQATVGKTHAGMSVGGHALPPHPLTLKWLHPPSSSPAPPPPPPPKHTTSPPPPPPRSSQVVQSAALFAGMKSEEVFCSQVCITFYGHIFFSPIICR